MLNNYTITKKQKFVLVKPCWFSELLLCNERLSQTRSVSKGFYQEEEEKEMSDIQQHIKKEFNIEVGTPLNPTVFSLSYLVWLKKSYLKHDEANLEQHANELYVKPALNFNLDDYNVIKRKTISENLLKNNIVIITYEDLFIDINPVLDIDKEEIKNYTTANLELAKKVCRMAGNYDLIEELDDYSVRVYRG